MMINGQKTLTVPEISYRRRRRRLPPSNTKGPLAR